MVGKAAGADAVKLNKLAAASYERAGMLQLAAQVQLDVADMSRANGALREAQEAAEKAVSLSRPINDTATAAAALLKWGEHRQPSATPATKGSLVEMLFQLRAERTQKSGRESELSYASRLTRLLKTIGSQGNDQDLLRCHRDYVPLYSSVENLWRDPVYDPRLEFFRLLTLSQRRLENEGAPDRYRFLEPTGVGDSFDSPVVLCRSGFIGLVGSVGRGSDLSAATASVVDAFVVWARDNHLFGPSLEFLASRLVADMANRMPAYLEKTAGNVSTEVVPYSVFNMLISRINNNGTETRDTAHLHGQRPGRVDVEDVIKRFQSRCYVGHSG